MGRAKKFEVYSKEKYDRFVQDNGAPGDDSDVAFQAICDEFQPAAVCPGASRMTNVCLGSHAYHFESTTLEFASGACTGGAGTALDNYPTSDFAGRPDEK